MFHYFRGELAMIDTSAAVVDCGGVGYHLTVSLMTADALSGMLGKEVKLYAYLQVREDAMELFGFHSKEELETFRLLIGVSGVGPKMAIGILSAFTPENFAAVKDKNVRIKGSTAFLTIPGGAPGEREFQLNYKEIKK